MTRRLAAGLLVGALALAPTHGPAWAESRPRYQGKISASLLGEPRSFDPIAATTPDDATVVSLLFDTLYRIDADGSAVPHLAIALPEIDAAQKVARIRLRPGVVFHDGSALTVSDVDRSLERLAASPAGWILAPVTAIRPGPGGDVIELQLGASAIAGMAGKASTGAVSLAVLLGLPQTAITRDGAAPSATRPIGSGAFTVAAIDRGAHRLRLAASDTHFAGRPYVDELELRWFDAADQDARRFEAGESQVSLRGPAPFTGGQPMYRFHDVVGPATILTYVGFGTAHRAVTKNASFRLALDLAIARAGFGSLGTGERVTPTAQAVPNGEVLGDAARAGDLPAAGKSLAAAAAAVPELQASKRAALRLEIIVDKTQPDDREVAERTARALDKLGIGAVVTPLPSDAFVQRRKQGDFDLMIAQLAGPVDQPALWWAAAFAAGGDDWGRKQLAGGKLDLAAARARQLAQHPIIPLFHRGLKATLRGDLRGIGFDGLGRLGFGDGFLEGKPQPLRKKGRP